MLNVINIIEMELVIRVRILVKAIRDSQLANALQNGMNPFLLPVKNKQYGKLFF